AGRIGIGEIELAEATERIPSVSVAGLQRRAAFKFGQRIGTSVAVGQPQLSGLIKQQDEQAHGQRHNRAARAAPLGCLLHGAVISYGRWWFRKVKFARLKIEAANLPSPGVR